MVCVLCVIDKLLFYDLPTDVTSTVYLSTL